MNCERCQVELEDFLYGELGAPRAAAVRAHLAACAACRGARDGLEREQEVFARYYEQAALEPPAEMWEAIRARLGEESRAAAGWRVRLREWLAFGPLAALLEPAMLRQVGLAAALVVVSAGATALFFSIRGEKRGEQGEQARKVEAPTPPITPQPGPSVAPPPAPGGEASKKGSPAPPPKTVSTPRSEAPLLAARKEPQPPSEDDLIARQVARAEREYQGAIRLLERSVARRAEPLDPALVAQYQESLALIDRSIAASRRALREHPQDPTAAQFLLAAYNKKVEIMQEIAMR